MTHQNFFEYQPTKDLNRFLREYGQACLNNSNPAPPSDQFVNITWQTDSVGNLSAFVPIGGTSLHFRGEWSSSTTYAIGDVVSFNGSSYVSSIANNLNNEPDQHPSDWTLLAQGGGSITPGTVHRIPFYTDDDTVGETTLTSDGDNLTIPDGSLNLTQAHVGPTFGPGVLTPSVNNVNSDWSVVGPGVNLGNAGGWTVSAGEFINQTVAQRGISQVRAGNFQRQAVGDTAGIYQYLRVDGGLAAQSDEGVIGANFQVLENETYFHGHVAATSGTGDLAPTLAYNSGSAWTTDGAFLMNISRPAVTTNLAGNGLDKWNSSFINLIPTTSTTLPLSTTVAQVVVGTSGPLTQVVSAGANAVYSYSSVASNPFGNLGALIGLPVTMTGFTNAVNNGTFTCVTVDSSTITLANASAVTETHAGLFQSPAICQPQVSANNPQPIVITVQLLNADSVTSIPFAVNDIVTVAGNSYPEQSKVVAVDAPIGSTQVITILVKNPNPLAYLFCGGLQGTYISSAQNLAFSGLRSSYYAYGSTDGINLIYAYNVRGSTTNSNSTLPISGYEAMTIDGQITLYPGAEIVSNNDTGFNCTLEPNRVHWTVNDLVENPHYPIAGINGASLIQQQVSPSNSSGGTACLNLTSRGFGFAGFNSVILNMTNTNPVTYYTNATTPGPLQPPNGIILRGPMASCITLTAQDHFPIINVEGSINPATALNTRQKVVTFEQYCELSSLDWVPDPDGADHGFYSVNNFNVDTLLTVGGTPVVNSVAALPVTDYTALKTDTLIVCTPIADMTVTLFSFTSASAIVRIANNGTANVTLACAVSTPFPTNGLVIPPGGCAEVVSTDLLGSYAVVSLFTP